MQKNTSNLWGNFWDTSNLKYLQSLVEKEQKSIRWRRIQKVVLARYGSFSKLRVVELGGGAGVYGVLFAQKGAKVTIIDYSPAALKLSSKLFSVFKVRGKFIKADILTLAKSHHSRYDISMSFGLAEHFFGRKRAVVVRWHLKVVRDGGLAIVSVPNRYSPVYRLYALWLKLFMRWPFGEEYPYTRTELLSILPDRHRHNLKFAGNSLFWPVSESIGTWLDEYFSYALVAFIQKRQ